MPILGFFSNNSFFKSSIVFFFIYVCLLQDAPECWVSFATATSSAIGSMIYGILLNLNIITTTECYVLFHYLDLDKLQFLTCDDLLSFLQSDYVQY